MPFLIYCVILVSLMLEYAIYFHKLNNYSFQGIKRHVGHNTYTCMYNDSVILKAIIDFNFNCRRRAISMVNLKKPKEKPLKSARQSKWDVSCVQWNQVPSHLNLFVTAVSYLVSIKLRKLCNRLSQRKFLHRKFLNR